MEQEELPENELLEYYEYPEALFGGVEVFIVQDEDDETPLKVLYVGGGFQSATFIDNRRFELVFEYYRAFDTMFEFAQQTGKELSSVLMLGAGACSYPKYLISRFPHLAVDAVEIDPVVAAIARKHFYLDEAIETYEAQERMSLIVADGRQYLDSTKTRYDAILNDCFTGQDLVLPLASKQAAQAIRACLNPGGVYLSNVVSKDDGCNVSDVQNVATTLAEVFNHVQVIPCFDETYAGEDNYLVIASDAPFSFSQALSQPEIFQGSVLED